MNDLDNRLFVINKKAGPTSFDIVEAFRRASRIRRVGHTGTLDPLAEGVLLLCSGKATRAVEHFMNLNKWYEFEVRLGVGTSTLDAEGEVTAEVPCPPLRDEEILATAEGFLGDCLLDPPAFSALKRNGKRLYELARAGETPHVEGRTVTIHVFEVTRIELPKVHFRLECSRGTYVRSLARDFGMKFGLPAHIRNLVRTAIGPFRIEDGYDGDRVTAGDVSEIEGIELSKALDFLPGIVVNDRAKRGLLNGALPGHGDVVKALGTPEDGVALRILDEKGELVAVGKRLSGVDRNRLTWVDSYRLFIDDKGARS
ncbi:MAG: tRNA pseudouridine(55) synthase TruB [Candidatus Latescibacterota bacterium]|nr:MAG: tRNA pseudouridine(55) synthase TruB [Candidatus Latescibacterota bacterium]